MLREIWTHAELFEEHDAAPAFINECQRLGLLRVVGQDGEGRPLYGSEARAELDKVLSLVALGYSPKDIAAIAKRVGLPKRKRGFFRKLPLCLRLDEVAGRTGVAVERLNTWVDAGVLLPMLHTESGDFLFASGVVSEVEELKGLEQLGLSDATLNAWACFRHALDEHQAGDESDLPQEVLDQGQALLDSIAKRLSHVELSCRRCQKLLNVYGKRLGRIARRSMPRPKARALRRRRSARVRRKTILS